MIKRRTHIFLTILFTALLAEAAMGSFTGSSEDKNKNKFSLKNLSKLSKNYSLSSLRTNNLQFKGTFSLGQIGTNATNPEYNSIIQMENGNTTYVYPYKLKVKVPRFKTPTPPSFR